MDTSLLHKKIKRFAETRKDKFSQEMVSDMESWLEATEQVLSEMELTEFELLQKLHELEQMIERLFKIIIILGGSEALLSMRVMDTVKLDAVLDLMIKSKARVKEFYCYAQLLELAENDGYKVEDITDLIRYARN